VVTEDENILMFLTTRFRLVKWILEDTIVAKAILLQLPMLRIVERSRGISHAVHLGKVSMAWLSEIVEALILEEG